MSKKKKTPIVEPDWASITSGLAQGVAYLESLPLGYKLTSDQEDALEDVRHECFRLKCEIEAMFETGEQS